MFGQGYALGVLVTTIGLYALSKWKMLAEREEDEYDNDWTN